MTDLNSGFHPKSEGMPEVVVTRMWPFKMQVCTTIPPEKKDTIDTALFRSSLNSSGTTRGWHANASVPAVPCASYPGRWHYLCNC